VGSRSFLFVGKITSNVNETAANINSAPTSHATVAPASQAPMAPAAATKARRACITVARRWLGQNGRCHRRATIHSRRVLYSVDVDCCTGEKCCCKNPNEFKYSPEGFAIALLPVRQSGRFPICCVEVQERCVVSPRFVRQALISRKLQRSQNSIKTRCQGWVRAVL
jgi:hypothetical protein